MRRLLLVLALGLPLAALGPLREDAADGSGTTMPALPLSAPASGSGGLDTRLASAAGAPGGGAGQTSAPAPTAPAPTAQTPGAASPTAPGAPGPASPPSAEPGPALASPFEGNKILAFYGKPGATSMGILGEYPKEKVANLLLGYAKLYADAIAKAEAASAPKPDSVAAAPGPDPSAAAQAIPASASLPGPAPGATAVEATAGSSDTAEAADEGPAIEVIPVSASGALPPSAPPAPPPLPGPPQRRTGVIPAFYIIYGACWPGGEIGYLKDSIVRDWIQYANSQGIIVFLDHQIGRYGVEDAMNRLLPWLVYPNVQLALDPEWRTEDPMRTIGSISAAELNKAQSMMSDWLGVHGIEGERILVVHQFAEKMITSRDKVRATWPGVRLVHTADGFGSPSLKRSTYAWNARATNMPRKGFKLFFKSKVPGAGYDEPLLSPEQVLSLVPSPDLIIYQ